MHKIVIALLLLSLAACSTVPEKPVDTGKWTRKPYKINGKWYRPIDSAYGFEETGIASWYGRDFHGRKTSNGEIYDMYAMTAAHKTLPMGTYVKVTRLDNGRETIVRINDRGPFVKGRIIDLSYRAAETLGMVDEGTAKVRIVALGEAKGNRLVKRDYARGSFFVQVGAFTVRSNAERLKAKLEGLYGKVFLSTFYKEGRLFYRVRIGSLDNLKEAQRLSERIEKDGFGMPFVVAN